MKKIVFLLLIVSAVFAAPVFISGTARAGGDWETEYDELCSGTTGSAGLTAAELKDMIERCDRLKPELEKLPDSEKKVRLKRLEMTRRFYSFMLESAEAKKDEAGETERKP